MSNDHEIIPFREKQQVWCSTRALVGVVYKVTDKAIHVRYLKDHSVEKFHFNPTHHTQSSIIEIQHYNT